MLYFPSGVRHHLPFVPLLLLLLLSGCAELPSQRVPESEASIGDDYSARTLYAEGAYARAAKAWLRLAESTPGPTGNPHRLAAAEAWLAAENLAGAEGIVLEMDHHSLSRSQRARHQILSARIALARHHAEQVLRLLNPEQPLSQEPSYRAWFHRLRANAYAGTGNHLEVARERVALAEFLLSPEERRENRRTLWDALSRLTATALQYAQLPPPDPLGGWIALASINKRYVGEPQNFVQALTAWASAWPEHGAHLELIPELNRASEVAVISRQHVALLLPLTGPFATAAAAVREGFLSAWYEETFEARPVISLYDTHDKALPTLYAEAKAAGADFVVGPLRRERVQELANSPPLMLPTLALNYPAAGGKMSDEGVLAPTPEKLYLFSLSPEDEARQVAERAWFDGHGRAAILVPSGDWGSRVHASFSTAWTRLGGILIETQSYTSSAHDMSTPVAQLLNIDDSERRRRALQKLLGSELKYETRPREDIDFVFLAAYPAEARQLRPQLKFHHASRLPIYATSHSFSGISDPRLDRDLDGIRFGDMPWVLQSGDYPLHQRLHSTWPDTFPPLSRLYAFGVDAYRIIPHLGRLQAQSGAELPGLSGRLRVGPDRRIQRALSWAKFVRGLPRVLDDEAR